MENIRYSRIGEPEIVRGDCCNGDCCNGDCCCQDVDCRVYLACIKKGCDQECQSESSTYNCLFDLTIILFIFLCFGFVTWLGSFPGPLCLVSNSPKECDQDVTQNENLILRFINGFLTIYILCVLFFVAFFVVPVIIYLLGTVYSAIVSIKNWSTNLLQETRGEFLSHESSVDVELQVFNKV
jgi:hypothetical protein